jgi:hypothetical protein
MCTSVETERLDWLRRHRFMSVEYNRPGSKYRGPSNKLQNEAAMFLCPTLHNERPTCVYRTSIHLFGGNVAKVKCIWEIGIAGKTDFAVVLFSVTKNDLPSKYQFYFQGNVIKINRIGESMFSVLAPIISGPQFKLLAERRTRKYLLLQVTLYIRALCTQNKGVKFSTSSFEMHFNNSNLKWKFLWYSCYLKTHLTL